MNKKLIVANWKMNPSLSDEAVRLAKKIDKSVSNKVDVVVAPPSLFLSDVGAVLKKAKLGSQNIFWESDGPYTGEISWLQLKNLKTEYVIIGHSERRRLGESDEMINKKVIAAIGAGFRAILCVGEPLVVRRKGMSAAKRFVANQLNKDLRGVNYLKIKNLKLKIIIAYEPIWAIGTGRPDNPQETVEMAKFIKSLLNSKFHILNSCILYGGSVNGQNTENFLRYKEIDGVLVGGASLKAEEFKKIIKTTIEYGSR